MTLAIEEGIVHAVNPRIGRIAVLTEQGYTVVDLIDGDARPQHRLAGQLQECGLVCLSNRTTGEPVEAVIEAVHASRSFASSLLRSR